MKRPRRSPLDRNRHLLLVLAVAWALGWYVTHFEPLNTWIDARGATEKTRCVDVYKQREELLVDCEYASSPNWAHYLARYRAADHDIPFLTYYDRYRDPKVVWWWIAVPIALAVLDILWTIYLAGRRRRVERHELREDGLV